MASASFIPTRMPNATSIVRDTASLDAAVKQVDLLNAELAQAKAALARSQAVQRAQQLGLGG